MREKSKSQRPGGTANGHRRVRRWTAILALAVAAPLCAAPEPRQLSLDETLTLTLEHDENVRIGRAALDAADAAVGGAHGAYDPLLELDGGWERSALPVNSAFSGAPAGELAPTATLGSGGASITELLPTGGSVRLHAASDRATTDGLFQLLSPAYDANLGVELRQPLLRHRSIDAARFGIRVAAAERGVAAAELRREVTDRISAAASAYWALVAARHATEVHQEAVRLADEQLEQTRDRISTGSAPETEIAQPRAELERRRGELLAAREAESRAENALKRFVLDDRDAATWSAPLEPTDEPDPKVAPADVDAALANALATRPELAAGTATLVRRRAERALAKDALLPGLDAVVAYDRFGLAGRRNPAATPIAGAPDGASSRLLGGWGDSVDQLGRGELDDTRLGLVLSVPLGNRRARADAAIARDAELQAEAELARERKQVRTDVLDAAAALDTAGQRIAAARAAREAAEVQLSAERDRYAAGMSTNFLVLTRQNDLSSARLDEIAALTDYRQAAVELDRASGSLLEEHGIQIEDVKSPIEKKQQSTKGER